MGTKNRPGAYDCYVKADPDEPLFVLLARDPLAPQLVRLWADLSGARKDKAQEARQCADDMELWYKEYSTK